MSNQLIQKAIAALEYHESQTRPVQSTTDVLAELRTALASKPQQPAKYSDVVSDGGLDMRDREQAKPAQTAEEYLRGKFGAYRGHHEWRALEEAFNAGLASQAQQPTDLSKQLREYAADSGYSHNDYADTMLAAASEIERCAARLEASQAQQPSIEDVQSLVDSSEIMLKWCVKNVQQWNFSEYDWMHRATEKVKASLPPAPEGGNK